MYVCLCSAVTSATVLGAIDEGALTSREVAQACGAGAECGRCRATIRGLIGGRNVKRQPAGRSAPDETYVQPQ